MKEKKLKIFKFFLCICSIFVLTIECFTVYATNSIFSDLNSKAYYYESVEEMYKKGYILGYPDGEFKAKNNITVAESLSILFRLSGINVPVIEEQEYWYDSVMALAKNLDIVKETVNPDSYATRMDIAKYIVKLYQLDITKTTVSDVFADTNLIIPNTMYQYNIFVGTPVILEDGQEGVAFLADANITRGDFCLVLSRLNEKIISPYTETLFYGDYEIPVNPCKHEDFMTLFKYMGEEGLIELRIPYLLSLNDIETYLLLRTNIIGAFEKSFNLYPEYFSFTPSLNIKRNIMTASKGELILTLYNDNILSEEVVSMRKQFDDACEDIILDLSQKGILREDLSDVEKARVLFEYVVTNVEYDTNYGVNSFTGYGAVIDGKAVCQGYTAMYNKLCRLVGLDIKAITGLIESTREYHMWSAILDKTTGEWYYSDTTFADPVPNVKDFCDFSYFYLPYEDIMFGRIED